MPLLTKEKINGVVAALFIIGMIITMYIDPKDLWASVSLSTGIAICLRQFLLGRIVDMILAIIIFGGISLTFGVSPYLPKILVPILLIVGAVYFIFCQYARYQEAQLHQIDSPKKHRE
jgi:predicted membrane protein